LHDPHTYFASRSRHDQHNTPAPVRRAHAVASEAMARALRAASPFPKPRRALQALRQTDVVAEHSDPEAQRLLTIALRNFVDEAFDEEAGIAMGIAAKPAGRQRQPHGH